MLSKQFTQNKAAIFFRSFFIAFLFLGFASIGLSQQVSMNHYQRKCEVFSLIVPSQSYNSRVFSIPFPDTLYSAGNVSIKKLQMNKIKAEGKFMFKNNVYTRVEYSFKKREEEEFLKLLQSSKGNFNWKKETINRKIVVTLTAK